MLKPAIVATRPASRTAALIALAALTVATVAGIDRARAEDTLTTMDGAPAQLSDYTGKGKWLAVMIWSVNCHICSEEMPHYGDAHRGGQNPRLNVLGVSLDGRPMLPLIEAFLEDRNGSFPNLVADLGPFAQEYGNLVGEGLMGTPTFLVYNPDGKLVGTQPGPMKMASLEQFIARKDAEAGRK